MAIEFPCPHCSQLLRVGDDSAGKTAKCPKCEGLAKIPADPAAFSGPQGGSSLGAPLPSSFGSPASGSFGESQPAKNPFSDGSASPNPYGTPAGFGAAPSDNPYASSQAAYLPPIDQSGPITPTVVGVEPILNHAWQIWQQNLGLLVGMTLVAGVISNVVTYLFAIPQFALEQNNEHEMAQLIAILGNIISNLVQIFLGIGEAQIVLKLARRQPAQFTDLFGGGSVFLPVLGGAILMGLAVGFGLLLLIVPGVILALMWWPTYYLLVEKKTGVFESFSVAAKISQGNWGNAFLLWLLSIGILLLGCLALCIGLLFAAPLVALLWGTAYLMMSGQLPIQPSYSKPSFTQPDFSQFGQAAPPK